MKIEWQPSYILHSRPYRDTSLILELFTLNQGRISTVARGAKKRGRGQGSLQAFTPLLTQTVGKTELLSLQKVETDGPAHYLTGNALLCGFYLNELLVRTLQRFDPHPQLYHAYVSSLQRLADNTSLDIILRRFELVLLRELGYAFDLNQEAHSAEPIQHEQYYHFDPEQGFTLVTQYDPRSTAIFCGASLLALHSFNLTNIEELRDAKRLLRLALAPLLGNKPLHTRELFK